MAGRKRKEKGSIVQVIEIIGNDISVPFCASNNYDGKKEALKVFKVVAKENLFAPAEITEALNSVEPTLIRDGYKLILVEVACQHL
jgi:hypothetical protein